MDTHEVEMRIEMVTREIRDLEDASNELKERAVRLIRQERLDGELPKLKDKIAKVRVYIDALRHYQNMLKDYEIFMSDL